MGKGSTQKNKTKSGPSPQQDSAIGLQGSLSLPVLAQLMQQITASLHGDTNNIPTLNNAMRSTDAANVQTNAGTSANLARAGVDGSMANNFSEQIGQQQGMGKSKMKQDILQQLMDMAPDIGLMRGSPVFQGATQTTSNQSSDSGSGGIMQAIASVVAAVASAYCHVALELYGPTNELKYARYWITYAWQGRLSNVVRYVYSRCSLQAAWSVRHSRVVRACVKPMFDVAVRKGREAY